MAVEVRANRLNFSVLTALYILFAMGGCSVIPDVANPVAWYKNLSSKLKGDVAVPSENSESGRSRGETDQGGDFPNLNSVPKSAPSVLSAKERDVIVSGLVADRANAKYADDPAPDESTPDELPPPPPPATADSAPPPPPPVVSAAETPPAPPPPPVMAAQKIPPPVAEPAPPPPPPPPVMAAQKIPPPVMAAQKIPPRLAPPPTQAPMKSPPTSAKPASRGDFNDFETVVIGGKNSSKSTHRSRVATKLPTVEVDEKQLVVGDAPVGGPARLLGTVSFGPGSSRLTPLGQRAVEAAAKSQRQSGGGIVVVSHGTPAVARAHFDAVSRSLTKLGVVPTAIRADIGSSATGSFGDPVEMYME